MKSSEIIQKIAQVVDPKHKVNLSKPDKSVLVEVFQVCCTPTSSYLTGTRLSADLTCVCHRASAGCLLWMGQSSKL